MANEILKLIDVRKWFPVQKGFLERLLAREKLFVKAVDGVTLTVWRGETLALVGESGCGKTTLGRLIVRLIEPTSGKIIFDGADITDLEGEELRKLRRRMQIIFQDPYASLNPRMPIGEQVAHPLKIHGLASGEEAKERVLKTLEQVGLSPPEKFYAAYPRMLSGGQRQRVAIARAIILRPELVVADEPVSMIDVSLRASILDLMSKLKQDLNLTYVFITHDLALSSELADYVAVMYLGQICEIGPTEALFTPPYHPYTEALLSAIPVPDPEVEKTKTKIRLVGPVPSAIDPPSGCRFHTRCPRKLGEICESEPPPWRHITDEHRIRCHMSVKDLCAMEPVIRSSE